MEGHELTKGERRALDAIEDRLRAESGGLDRRLREMTPGIRQRLLRVAEQPLACLALMLGVASALLLVLAVRSASVGIVWGFAGCWTATLLTSAAVSRAASAERHAPVS